MKIRRKILRLGMVFITAAILSIPVSKLLIELCYMAHPSPTHIPWQFESPTWTRWLLAFVMAFISTAIDGVASRWSLFGNKREGAIGTLVMSALPALLVTIYMMTAFGSFIIPAFIFLTALGFYGFFYAYISRCLIMHVRQAWKRLGLNVGNDRGRYVHGFHIVCNPW